MTERILNVSIHSKKLVDSAKIGQRWLHTAQFTFTALKEHCYATNPQEEMSLPQVIVLGP